MNTKNDGGPAFPVPNDANVNGQEGMSLRDYFAAKALNALICDDPAGTAFGVDHMYTNMNYALASYAIADAMLAAREPQK